MGEEAAARRLRAGTVGRPHGLDGSVHVGAVVDDVFARLAVGSDVQLGERTWRIARLAGHAGRPLIRLEGCEDREAAEALGCLEIHLAREAMPPLGEDEWWAEDLEGCAVRDGEREVGTVAALLGLPSCEVLEVRRAGRGDADALLVPLIRDAVRSVDVDTRVIDVDLAFLGEA